MADVAAASDRILAKYDLDNFDQATPAIDAEHMLLVNEVKRRHGVPII